MRLQRYSNVAAFAARVTPYLATAEAQHCLQLGNLAILAIRLTAFGGEPYMALVEDENHRIALVALRTPPHNLILSQLAGWAERESVFDPLISDMRAASGSAPGVIGPDGLVQAFAEAWSAQTGAAHRAGIRERIYQLCEVRWPRPTPGAMRAIEENDRATLRVWLNAFMREALGVEAHDVDSEIDRRLGGEGTGMYLWEDGQPASLAGYGGPTPHGIRIGLVYTPPDARGRGYASALVAHMSQRLLDEGRTYCFLFTDVANRTSNHIYQEIGYEPVGDAAEIKFDLAPRAV